MGQENAANKDEVQPSFGAMLKQARLKQNLRLEDISAKLFILQRHLQALEEERFDELPQAAFARGFAINYAKFLGLDSVQIASEFDAVYPKALIQRSKPTMTTPLQPMGSLSPSHNNRVRFSPLLIIAITALIVLVVFLSRMVSNAQQKPELSPPLAEDLTTQAQEQGAAVNTEVNDVNVGNTVLGVILTDSTMVNIIDATGNRLITGNQMQGKYQLAGTPPFKIDIGNINNVSLLVNQEPVSLNDYVTESDDATGKQINFELTL